MITFPRRAALIAGAAALLAAPLFIGSANAETTHEIQMLNKHPDGKGNMVFYPNVIRIDAGDTVKFLPEDPGHNSASTRGGSPKGEKGWKGRINKEVEVTLTTPGFYAYNCTPHKPSGMVGLVIVAGPGMMDNMEAVKGLRQVGKGKQVWAAIWEQAEADGLLAEYSPEAEETAEAAVDETGEMMEQAAEKLDEATSMMEKGDAS
ncbi:MAG: plastocyanin/azurin family copper-binding protein [Sphingomonadales bacterium]